MNILIAILLTFYSLYNLLCDYFYVSEEQF